MEGFAAHGYQRVKPPLLEFEDSLLAGSGAAVAEQTFRLMDPESQRMMGLRADTTPQVARIATTRLAHAPRPLRLSYAGQCLHVRGSQLAPDRQIAQAGIELIGCDNPAADAEIVLVGAEALASVGLMRTSFDFTLPTLVPILLDDAEFTGPTATSQRVAAGNRIVTTAAFFIHADPRFKQRGRRILRATYTRQRVRFTRPATGSRRRSRRFSPLTDLRLTVDLVEFRGSATRPAFVTIAPRPARGTGPRRAP
jgi:ATP phosphoribosyltransferase regulatory subunit HisZ